MNQEIRFCVASDDVRIAFAKAGLVKPANYIT